VGARETCRDLIEDRAWLKTLAFPAAPKNGGIEGEPEVAERSYVVEVSGKRFDVRVLGDALAAPASNGAAAAPARPRRERSSASGGGGGDTLSSPLQGNVFKVLVEQGATVEEGALICIIEAMKMENEITAHKAGVISDLPIARATPSRPAPPSPSSPTPRGASQSPGRLMHIYAQVTNDPARVAKTLA
jgi:acetyl-CoA/propionyl-CoA carboxylase biotin carboxyl carrier protein